MSKDRITGRNKELLQETARRLGISEDEVYSKIPEGILFMAQFNPKILGGHLKRMELDMPQEEVLKKQIADDTFLASLNKTQENSPQQQEATSSTASCQENTLGWSDANKKLLKTIG